MVKPARHYAFAENSEDRLTIERVGAFTMSGISQ